MCSVISVLNDDDDDDVGIDILLVLKQRAIRVQIFGNMPQKHIPSFNFCSATR